jgi:epoxyqueuosine reductase
LVELFSWDEESFLKNTEGSPIRRAGYERWLRNLAVALGNAARESSDAAERERYLAALRARRDDPSEMVREHVEWALNSARTFNNE